MKKSQSIRLTVVAAMALAARAQQTPAPPTAQAPTQTCEERQKLAQAAGTKLTEACHSSTAHGATRGGFGATGKGQSSGG